MAETRFQACCEALYIEKPTLINSFLHPKPQKRFLAGIFGTVGEILRLTKPLFLQLFRCNTELKVM